MFVTPIKRFARALMKEILSTMMSSKVVPRCGAERVKRPFTQDLGLLVSKRGEREPSFVESTSAWKPYKVGGVWFY
jgi:hypothetical protein